MLKGSGQGNGITSGHPFFSPQSAFHSLMLQEGSLNGEPRTPSPEDEHPPNRVIQEKDRNRSRAGAYLQFWPEC